MHVLHNCPMYCLSLLCTYCTADPHCLHLITACTVQLTWTTFCPCWSGTQSLLPASHSSTSCKPKQPNQDRPRYVSAGVQNGKVQGDSTSSDATTGRSGEAINVSAEVEHGRLHGASTSADA
jgi:hypothetical protein